MTMTFDELLAELKVVVEQPIERGSSNRDYQIMGILSGMILDLTAFLKIGGHIRNDKTRLAIDECREILNKHVDLFTK